jgi:hypothetical protein
MAIKAFFLIGFFISILILSLFLLRGDEDTWICRDGQWVKHGNPRDPAPEIGCGTTNQLVDSGKISLMQITSTAFADNENIPPKYTCDGENINPPLVMSDIPAETKSSVLIINDPDAPAGNWIHWILFNIPSNIIAINENEIPAEALQGQNSFGENNYGGPCPPSGTHKYIFTLYALNNILDLEEGVSENEVKDAMENHILESSQLIGFYR